MHTPLENNSNHPESTRINTVIRRKAAKQGTCSHRFVLQHFCDFHGKQVIINQIIWHGRQVAKAMPKIYLHKP